MTKTHAHVYLAFGSNLGDRRENIAEGLAMLHESGQVKVTEVSSLYETEPVGYTQQGLFLNAVARVETDLSPLDLLSLCKDVEVRVGRKPTVRWGPRILDIDILMYFAESDDTLLSGLGNSGEDGTEVKMDTPTLTLPHPRIWERGFVIIPLAEVNPDLVIPDGRRIKSLIQDLQVWTGLRLFEAAPWWHYADQNRKGWQVMRFTEVESTNTIAANLASVGATEGTCVIAETQSAGRGRRGRVWHSPPGGLWLSILLRPTIQSQDVGRLSLIAGVAVSSAIRETFQLPAVVKWPNDVLISGKKVCGILPETRFLGDKMDFAIVGIGVNVAIDTDLLPLDVKETSATLLSPDYPYASGAREALTASILNNFSRLYKQFLSEGFLEILQEVREYCDTLGREVTVSRLGMPIQGIAVDIDSDARLIIRTKSGEDVHVISGEVSIGVPGAG